MNRVASAFINQADQSKRLKSDFMERLCLLLAESTQNGGVLSRETRVGRYLHDWPGDISFNGASVALRICGALHAVKLSGEPKLAAVYPPNKTDDSSLLDAVTEVIETNGGEIIDFIQRPPQTNEVRRSIALIAAGHLLSERFNLPITTYELGASAGLNLNWADYGLETQYGYLGNPEPALTLKTDWSGPIPAGSPATVIDRRGVDLSPLDVTKDSLRLRAFIWPDQFERITAIEEAIAHAQTQKTNTAIYQSDAADWLATQLSPDKQPPPAPPTTSAAPAAAPPTTAAGPAATEKAIRMVYHTVAWQYFAPETQTRLRETIETVGAAATEDNPLVWISMEVDTQGPGAALTMRLWPGDHAIALARVDFHGRWIRWQYNTKL